tara:strand:- start:83 stop:277 length:195 start_codon:yes stop_codon:yes gene_type:complete
MNYKHDELLKVELQIKHYEATLNHKKASLYILERDIEHLEKTLAQLRIRNLSMISHLKIIKKNK